MKTDLDELSALYLASLAERMPTERPPCPSKERLLGCILLETPQKERDEIVSHVADCSACAAVLKVALEVAAETDKFAASAARLTRAHAGECAKREGLLARLVRKPALAVAAGLMVLAVISLSVLRLADHSGTRGGTTAGIVLVSPVKSMPAGTGIVFKWQPVPNAGQCIVEIFDEAFQLVWRSGPVSGDEVQPPSETMHRLAPGRAYYWRVTAVAEGRPDVKSKLAEFSVRD